MLLVLSEVIVTFVGTNCEEVRWPVLHPGERPVVWISQDECAFHSNDDLNSEWAEEGKGLQIKQKSRGSLLMVSMFITELHGILECTREQREAYMSAHLNSYMAARLAAQPDWNGSSTLILEPGAAPGKDKYFDAEQLIEQTKLAIEVFEATHFAPERWAFHPAGHAPSSRASYPQAFQSVLLPRTPCIGLFLFDHSSGHGAFSKDALLASHANKGPDWKGSMAAMRDGFFVDAKGAKKTQVMQFQEGDSLPRDITYPVGLDPQASAPAPAVPSPADGTQPQAPPQTPPTPEELVSAFKLFFSGSQQTLKKNNPSVTADGVKLMGRAKWDALSADRQMVYVGRCRAKAAGPAGGGAPTDRVIKAGSAAPRILWGRNKGLECILTERGLYPAAGLKGACQMEKDHTPSNDCCCARLLSVQPDFASECSALQHLVEEPYLTGGARHLCIFLPKFHCELNLIERFWGASKDYARKHCLYTLPGLRETVPISLSQNTSSLPAHLRGGPDLPVAPLFLQLRWARISRAFMAEYRKGVDACDAIKAVKGQRGSKRHRDPNDSRSKNVEAAAAALAMGSDNVWI